MLVVVVIVVSKPQKFWKKFIRTRLDLYFVMEWSSCQSTDLSSLTHLKSLVSNSSTICFNILVEKEKEKQTDFIKFKIFVDFRKMNFVKFVSNKKKGVFRNSYYACLKDNNPIKNNIKCEYFEL